MTYDTPESVADFSESQLLVIAGEQILPPGFAVDDREVEEKKKDGRQWFQQTLRRTRANVCQHVTVRAFLRKETSYDQTLLIAAIADVVSGATAGVSPFVAGALFVHYGLEKICAQCDE